ncbi:EAL domain-containing protein [Caldimonas tepidiphila]|uniref:EAL domain-containing protein n=1 Tax=Caldimonas tepidiphila TaxID=2315841 RepID=UPI000E5AE78C|nr:EAL domain-containing protein [Caldimonas tepidiphila]
MSIPWPAPDYDPATVAASLLMGTFAAFVALDLVRRPATGDPVLAKGWLVAGAIAMGTGVWSMHFIGMLAYRGLGPVGYDYELTLLSWLAAVMASGLALTLAGGAIFAKPGGAARARAGLAFGALLMAAGVCSMHYLGMMAMRMSPPIVWDPWWVAASVLVALASSAAALVFFGRMRGSEGRPRGRWHVLAAVAMGLGISSMHYTGMAAATFVEGSVCLAAGELSGRGAGTFVGAASFALLGLTLLSSQLEKRTRTRSAQLTETLREANAELQRKAFGDPLTGLPNRLVFEDRLAHARARCDRYGDSAAVLFIDLDGFKPINDDWGHDAGDRVLQEIAARLRHFARESDTVARLGGDEFVVLVEGRDEVAMAGRLAQRVIDAVRRPVAVGEREARLSCSIGIALYPQDGPAEQLLGHADAAMYEAKRAGRGTFRFYDLRMDAGVREAQQLGHELLQGLARGEFELFYQPTIDARSGALTGAEALARWNHPARGRLEAAAFMPVVERHGRASSFGDWALRSAVAQARDWEHEGLRLSLAVNLCGYQLDSGELAQRLEDLLAEHGVPPERLTLEIGEPAMMRDGEARRGTLGGLAAAGIALSVDDFGTGASSLGSLRRLPLQRLKIDRSLVRELPGDPDARAIVHAALQLGHALDLVVVAEGVETQAQHDLLRSLGCDEMQGYLYAPPMPAAEFGRWAAGAVQPRGPAGLRVQ